MSISNNPDAAAHTFDSSSPTAKITPADLSEQSRIDFEIFLKSVSTYLSLNDDDSRKALRSLFNNVTNSSNQSLKDGLAPILANLNDYLKNQDSSKAAASLTDLVASTLKHTIEPALI